MWHTYTMEYYSAIKRNELLIHTTWMYLKRIILSEKSQSQKLTYTIITIKIAINKKFMHIRFMYFLFFKIVLMWTIFKAIIEFVTILLLFYILVFWLRGTWDLSSPTRDRTRTAPCIGKRSLNHWTAREVPDLRIFMNISVR